MWSFPSEWEDALWEAARAELPESLLDQKALVAAIADRTRRYTSERERLGARLSGKAAQRDLAARALFFTVADAAKVQVPVAELVGRGLLPSAAPLRVLDVGAGCGAMSLGLAAALPGRPLRVRAIDQDAAALSLLGAAAARAPRSLDIEAQVADVRRPIEGVHDVIVAGTVLNELSPNDRLPLVTRLLSQNLAPDGALILVEPALRETSRDLHELRDALLRAGAAHVFAPCTRRSAPCPALADSSDWCHEDRPFSPPPRLARLSRATGLRREGLKFSYLTLRRAADPLCPEPGALRVVSDPVDQKGTIERYVCGDDGKTRLRVLKRDAPDRDLTRSRRGDVLVPAGGGTLRCHRPAWAGSELVLQPR